MKFAAILQLALSLALFAVASGKPWGISYTPAGPLSGFYSKARPLRPNARLCLGWYHRGITFKCRGRMIAPVRMYVNNKLVRTEWKYPFTTSSTQGRIFPTKNLLWNKWNNVRCVSGRYGGASYSVNFFVGPCVFKRKPHRKHFRPLKRVRRVVKRFVHRPKRVHHKPKHVHRKPKRFHYKPKPKHRASRVVKRIVRSKPFRRVRRVFKPAHKKRNPIQWRGGCTVIDGRVPTMNWKLPAGWTREPWGGVTYKKGDKFAGVFKPGTAPLHYRFWVPRRSRYAVVLDMSTTHVTEHNDVFLRFNHGRGFHAKKAGKTLYLGRGWIKAYHNKNGRMMAAFTKDFDPHSFVTADVLSPKRHYWITIGARSTQITIHRILLIACSGKSCDYTNGQFYLNLAQCGKY